VIEEVNQGGNNMPCHTLQNFINGNWKDPVSDRFLEVDNPSNRTIISRSPLSTDEDVQEAVEAAKSAFRGWANTPVSRRCELLIKLAELLRQNQEKIARLIAEEMGKSLPDARAEIKRTLENTEVACGMPMLQQGDKPF